MTVTLKKYWFQKNMQLKQSEGITMFLIHIMTAK